MTFVYISERERWRTTMLLLWKRGPLKADNGSISGQTPPIVKLICEYCAPPWPTKPLKKLTMNLINTYTGINESYYAAKTKYTKSQPAGNSNGNFVWGSQKSLVLNKRYELREQIGSGAFGVVMGALDLQTKEHVAIKIIKAKRAYSQQAKREIGLLQDLRAKDEDGSSNVVELRGHFVYNNPGIGSHECLVFEKLNSNLYTLLESTGFNGFSLVVVRKFCDQLLKSLAFLARPGVRVIHTDIKPENICIRYPRRSAIKLIDFGSSCNEGNQLFSYIQSRYYRSPEVLLGYGYTVAIDMWSLACVLVEMHTGTPLFSGDNMIDQIRKIMTFLGLPPDKMVETFRPEEKRNQLFTLNPNVCDEKSPNTTSEDDMSDTKPLDKTNERKWLPVQPNNVGVKNLMSLFEHGKWKGESGNTTADIEQFHDLLTKILEYDPKLRITPMEALQHPFITQEYPGSVRDIELQKTGTRSNVSGGGAAGGPVNRQEQTMDMISDSQYGELSSTLVNLGCPFEKLKILKLKWENIENLLTEYTIYNHSSLLLIQRSFDEFLNERLRSRQQASLQVFIDLLIATCKNKEIQSTRITETSPKVTIDLSQENMSDTPIP